MKKRGSRLLALLMVLILGLFPALAGAAGIEGKPSTTTFTLDGKPLDISGYEINGNNYFKLRDLLGALGVEVTYDAATNAANIITKQTPSKPSASAEKKLKEGNWAPETRAAIQAVIDKNANQGKYVVFDFDNTSVINDVEEALLVYQIENLAFKIAPDQMYDVLKTQIPDMNKEVGTNDQKKPVTCHSLATDITKAYKWLYESYEGLGGNQPLDKIHESKQYQDFAAKLRYMYTAVGDTFDASVSYPWVTYLFTGMTSEEVYKLAGESHRYWSKYGKFTEESWVSPADYPSESGQLTAKYLTGLTFTNELTDLYQTLMANGIDVYVCSASFIDVIKAAACDPEFGYNVPEDQVYAMRLKTDAQGRYLPEYDYDWGGKGKYAQTQAVGKSKVITAYIQPKYKGAGPLMVFGDSAGDYNMMTDYPDTQLGVIFNRYRKPSDPIHKLCVIASKNIGKDDPKYVLQGRDNNTGNLIPTQYSRMLGEKELVLVRPVS